MPCRCSQDNKPEYGGQPDFSDHWVPDVYDRRLGQPNGDGEYNPLTGQWSRGFGMNNGRPRVSVWCKCSSFLCVFFRRGSKKLLHTTVDTATNLGNIQWS